jgi:alpha-methylacyl-CoA racemase
MTSQVSRPDRTGRSTGPPHGLRVAKLAGIGPAPFCGMFLADLGADVTRIDRPHRQAANSLDPEHDLLARGRRSLMLDLKPAAGVATLLRLIDSADALIEGLRPSVSKRLGFGPGVCTERNPRLVYAA